MKKYLFYFLVLSLVVATGPTISAQVKLPAYPDSLFPTYYHQRVTLFRALPQTKEDIIFLGNSITDGGEWGELFNDIKIKNRGISGDITAGVLHRLDELANGKPAKVFLLIGVNDLARNITADSIKFDTVFTTTGSITKSFKIINENIKVDINFCFAFLSFVFAGADRFS